jgi:hypothetical protein
VQQHRSNHALYPTLTEASPGTWSQHASSDLIFLNGLKMRAKIAFAKALIAFSFDELEED